MDVDNFRLAGQWLYYGLYQMLVIALGSVLTLPGRGGGKHGLFKIVSRMMDFVSAEFTHARQLGHVDLGNCPYHYDLRDYVGLALRVMRVCRRCLGGAVALTYVSSTVEQVVAASACVSVRGFGGNTGLCPIC